MFWLLVVLAVFWTIVLIDFSIGFRKISSIDGISPQSYQDKLSVIIAAKDEETSIESTIRSLANQKNIRLEIIVVNDRSIDRTGEIARGLAKEFANVNAITIDELPDGWLGKNHALACGVLESTSDYLIFTDADIQFKEKAIAKAFHEFKEMDLDHLTAAPDLQGRSFWLKGLISFFLFGFGYLKRPWTANQSGSKGGMGIGAFQLITRPCYEAIGGHQAIKFRPDDDLVLGQRVKKFGFKQRLVTSLDSMSVEWYPSLRAAFRGFEKNAFAGLNYSVGLAVFAVAGVLISHVFPFIFLFTSSFEVQMISALNIVLLFCLYALTLTYLTNYSRWFVFGLPLFALLFVYMLTRALCLTWIRGGIEWRGSRYSLKQLKREFKRSEEDEPR
ncbi:glycosyltransferase [Halobacillus fulvus]|nr:glycosyltransferase [Halobacillus fulvus]